MEDLNLPHRTAYTLRFDIITDLIRFKQKDNQPAGEVRQVSAQRHTDSDTGRSKQCSKRSRLYSQRPYNGNDQQDHQRNIHQTSYECFNRQIKITFR